MAPLVNFACRFRLQACGESTVVPLRERAVDQEPEAFFKAERHDVRHLELLDQGTVGLAGAGVLASRWSHTDAGESQGVF